MSVLSKILLQDYSMCYNCYERELFSTADLSLLVLYFDEMFNYLFPIPSNQWATHGRRPVRQQLFSWDGASSRRP